MFYKTSIEQNLANRGPNLRFVLEAINKALIFKSSSGLVTKLMDQTQLLNLMVNLESRVP